METMNQLIDSFTRNEQSFATIIFFHAQQTMQWTRIQGDYLQRIDIKRLVAFNQTHIDLAEAVNVSFRQSLVILESFLWIHDDLEVRKGEESIKQLRQLAKNQPPLCHLLDATGEWLIALAHVVKIMYRRFPEANKSEQHLMTKQIIRIFAAMADLHEGLYRKRSEIYDWMGSSEEQRTHAMHRLSWSSRKKSECLELLEFTKHRIRQWPTTHSESLQQTLVNLSTIKGFYFINEGGDKSYPNQRFYPPYLNKSHSVHLKIKNKLYFPSNAT